jgi:hypothetical protein
MMTESTQLARLIAGVLRLSDADVESDERWAGVAELRQLLEGTRIEYSVPRQKDVCKHRDRRRSRAAGPQIGGKMAKVRRSRLFGQLPGRNKLKIGSRLLVSPLPEIKFSRKR